MSKADPWQKEQFIVLNNGVLNSHFALNKVIEKVAAKC